MRYQNTQKSINHGTGGASKKLLAAMFLAGVFVLQACGGGASNNENAGNNPNNNGNGSGSGAQTYNGPPPANSDIQSFRIQLWENIRANNRCGSCHDVGGQGNSAFANNSDVNAAYTVANTVVNPTDIPASRLVTKFSQGSGHFCWESTQSACAAQLEIWISNWLNGNSGTGRGIVLVPPQDENPAPATNFDNTVHPSYYSGNSNITIHQLVTTHCVGCHVPNATQGPAQQPYFAVPVAQNSYDVVSAVPLINLNTAALSRIYTRLATDGHRCWDSPNDAVTGVDCAGSAADMLNAINYYITNGVPVADMAELNSMVTSRAVTLLEDGISASGGNRYEASQIALYEFKLNGGDTIIDRSGVSPSMNLTLFGTEGTDYEWLGSYGIKFNTATAKAQAQPSDSDKLHTMIVSTGEYSVEAWLIPGNVNQENTTIVGYGRSATDRNFLVGQTLYNYEAYNSNLDAASDAAGAPLSKTVDNDERAQAVLQHVVVTYDPINGRRIYVNGVFTNNVDPVPGAGLDWRSGAALVLGNETDRSRPWSGTVRLVAMHNRALTETQIRQNFDVGVGQKYYLMFDISHHLGAECRGADPNPAIDDPVRDPDYAPKCFIYMEAAQFDNTSFLFAYPRFIALDTSIDPTGVRIRGMRVGINGREASNSQAFASMDVTIDNTYDSGAGQLLSPIGTIIALENGPSGAPPDQIFLSFEELSGVTPTKSYVESFPTTPQAMNPAEKSAVMIRNFEEINAAMAAMTGVNRTLTAINWNVAIDGNANSNGTYISVLQGLPSSSEVDTFVPSQQMAVTQLAIEYCNALVDGNGTIAPGTYFPTVTFNASSPNMAFTTQGERDLIITPLLERVLNVEGATVLTTMPDAALVRTHLNWLMNGDAGPPVITGLNASCSGNCGVARTKTIIKSVCAAAIAGAPMLLQ